MPKQNERKQRARPEQNRRERAGNVESAFLFVKAWFAGASLAAKLGAWVVAAAAFLGAAVAIIGYLQSAWSWAFRYPVKIESVDQRETDVGYLLSLTIKSTNGSTVFIPTDQFRLEVVREEQVVEGLSDEQRQKLVYGEKVRVFDNAQVVDAVLAGRTFANAANTIECSETPRDLFLLLTVSGPGSPNPSARLGLGRAYRSLRVSIRRRLLDLEYLDVRIAHVPVIGADEKTHVIER